MRTFKTALPGILLLSVLFLAACQSSRTPSANDIEATANELAQRTIIVDGHIDVPIRLYNQGKRGQLLDDVSQRTAGGDFDFVRAKAGGLNAPFMSIYIPAVYQTLGGARKFADGLIDLVYQLEAEHGDKFQVAHSPRDVTAAFRAGKVALPMGMENGAGIEDSLPNLRHFFDRGVRYITLTHSKDNKICDSSYDTTRTWNGLSPFGAEVVREMNRLGIMVDISHVSDSAFYQVLEITEAPVIASHSSARYFTPGFERNMNDEMIRRLAQNDGVIMINFGSTFLDSASRNYFDQRRDAIADFYIDNEIGRGDSLAAAFIAEYDRKNPPRYASVMTVANHIDHIAHLVGTRHIGFGSDFDGVGNTLPTGLKDVSMYPNLIAELLRRGFTEDDIERMCYGNLFRVWRHVESVAFEIQNEALRNRGPKPVQVID